MEEGTPHSLGYLNKALPGSIRRADPGVTPTKNELRDPVEGAEAPITVRPPKHRVLCTSSNSTECLSIDTQCNIPHLSIIKTIATIRGFENKNNKGYKCDFHKGVNGLGRSTVSYPSVQDLTLYLVNNELFYKLRYNNKLEANHVIKVKLLVH